MEKWEREAKTFAKWWHTGQYRKYTNDTVPYYLHCGAVARLLKTHVPSATREMIIAAWLHDTLEDTDVTALEIYNTFGSVVLQHVEDLTERKYPGCGRRERKERELARLSQVSIGSKTIKLADLLDNAKDILEKDKDFAVVYLREKRDLLTYALKDGDPVLWALCDRVVEDGLKLLSEFKGISSMKTGLTDITLIVDRSGSMNKIYNDTIGGLNSFLQSQRAVEGEAVFSAVQFDDKYEQVVTGIDIQRVTNFTPGYDFMPRGSTALYDALGRTITAIGARLKALSEEARPERVMVVIVTDGKENASEEFTKKQVFDMIKHQTDVYKWDFTYIGANQDSMQSGAAIGIAASKTMDYSHTGVGARGAFAAASNYTHSFRAAPTREAASASAFTAEDRKAAAGDSAGLKPDSTV